MISILVLMAQIDLYTVARYKLLAKFRFLFRGFFRREKGATLYFFALNSGVNFGAKFLNDYLAIYNNYAIVNY